MGSRSQGAAWRVSGFSCIAPSSASSPPHRVTIMGTGAVAQGRDMWWREGTTIIINLRTAQATLIPDLSQSSAGPLPNKAIHLASTLEEDSTQGSIQALFLSLATSWKTRCEC